MPTNTYTPIASVTLSATASEVVFSGLPQTFRDLIVVITGGASQASYAGIRFNSDPSNYTSVDAKWEVNSITTDAGAFGWIPQRYTATANNVTTYQVMDYSATDKHKTALVRGNTATNQVYMAAGRWASNSAITSLTCAMESGRTWNSGSTFTIFGVIA